MTASGTWGASSARWVAMRRRPDGTEVKVEVTTYRSDTYDPDSRKPEVNYGDTLEGVLSRRDFTVNAMALRAPTCNRRPVR